MTAARSMAAELETCRRTARDCELIIALAGGVPLAPHEFEEAREAKRRIAAAVGMAALAKGNQE